MYEYITAYQYYYIGHASSAQNHTQFLETFRKVCEEQIPSDLDVKLDELSITRDNRIKIVLNGSRSLLAIALSTLAIGRSDMKQAEREGSDFSRAMDHLDKAVTGLRDAGAQYHIPRGLLARAACYRLQGLFPKAWEDLNEAKEIAESGDMKLHLVDYHLEAARVCSAEGKTKESKEHYKIAAQLIEETGYHRRDGEVRA